MATQISCPDASVCFLQALSVSGRCALKPDLQGDAKPPEQGTEGGCQPDTLIGAGCVQWTSR